MGRQNQQSVVHPFISRGRHQMTHLWHFVVQKIITTAIEVCIGLFMCPLFSLCSSICQCWCQPLPNPATAPRPMDPVICVTTGYFVSSLCHISPPPLPHFRPPFPPFNPLLIHLVTSPRPRTCKQLTQSRRKTVRLKIICSDDLWIKSMGGRRLCYISSSIPVILEFISIENQSQTVYLKDLWVKRPDENRISEMTLEFYIENHF